MHWGLASRRYKVHYSSLPLEWNGNRGTAPSFGFESQTGTGTVAVTFLPRPYRFAP